MREILKEWLAELWQKRKVVSRRGFSSEPMEGIVENKTFKSGRSGRVRVSEEGELLIGVEIDDRELSERVEGESYRRERMEDEVDRRGRGLVRN